jgi:hypothetical protein
MVRSRFRRISGLRWRHRLLDRRGSALGAKNLRDLPALLGKETVKLEGLGEGFDMEDYVIFNNGCQAGLVGSLSHHFEELAYPEARIGKQELIVVKFLAELKEIRKRSIDRKTVGNGHCAKIVEQKIHAPARRKFADMNRFCVLANPQRRQLVFEITGSAPLVRHSLALGRLVNPPFGQLKIDRARRIVGEDQTRALLNLPFDRRRKFLVIPFNHDF